MQVEAGAVRGEPLGLPADVTEELVAPAAADAADIARQIVGDRRGGIVGVADRCRLLPAAVGILGSTKRPAAGGRPATITVRSGFGRVVALHSRSSTLYRITKPIGGYV
jgi:hypothetical protein